MRDRMMKMFAVAALLCPAFVLVGCKSGGTGVTLAEPVTIVESANGSSSALKSIGPRLIRTQAEFDALGDADIFPGGVDFDQYDLVIIALGEQPTGGYAVDITSIQREGDTLYVVGKASTPAADAVVTQALTYPFDAAIIANTDAKSVLPQID